MEMFYNLIVMLATYGYMFVKIHQVLHLKWVYLILLLNNVDLKTKQQIYLQKHWGHIYCTRDTTMSEIQWI